MARRQRAGAGRTIAVGWSQDDAAEGTSAPAASGTGPGSDAGRATSSPTTAPTTSPPAAPSAAGRIRRRPLLLIGAIATVLALAVVLPLVLLGGPTAEQVAQRYLEAVRTGDAQTVREHLLPQADVLDIALDDAVLAATSDPLERFTIDQVAIDGDRAEVSATFVRGEESYVVDLHLTRHREGLLRRPVWELEPVQLPVVRAQIPVGSEALWINGQRREIPAPLQSQYRFGTDEIRLHVLPGTVELEAQELGENVTPSPVRTDVPPVLGEWTSQPVVVGYDLTDQGEQELHDRLIDSLETCARSSSPHPAECPLDAGPGVSGPGSWELTGTPAVLTEQDHDFTLLTVSVEAEFTAPPGGSSTEEQIHRVDVVAPAMAVLDRDGRFHTDWLLGADVGGAPAGQ